MITLDWQAIYSLQENSLHTILSQHKEVFEEGLGTLRDNRLGS